MKPGASTSRHPIQLVAQRTGLSQDVLRAWERRHGVVRPRRSEGNRRLYSDNDIRRLTLLRQLVAGEHRIGDVAHLTDAELESLLRPGEMTSDRRTGPPAQPPSPAEPRAHLDGCLAAIEALDNEALYRALGRARLDLSSTVLCEKLLVPLLESVGRRWQEGRSRIAQEHLTTHMVSLMLGTIRASFPAPEGAPTLVVTTPPRQVHEVGALLAATTAAVEGWKVTYLGPSLPAEEIAMAAAQVSARAVALSIVYPPDDPLISDELRRLRTHLGDRYPILVGGRAASAYDPVLAEIDAPPISSLSGLRVALARLRA